MRKLSIPPVFCDNCGKRISIRNMRQFNQKHHFCSIVCRNSGKVMGMAVRKSPRRQYTCEVCGKKCQALESRFERGAMRFCSRACQGVSKRTELAGKNSVRFNQVPFICVICQKEFFRKSSRVGKSKTCSNSCRFKLLQRLNAGRGNPAYIHGKSNEPYPIEFSRELRDSIIIRDGDKCIECGISREEHRNKYNFDLNVHHIDYNKENIDRTNLLTLCLSCHGKTQKRPIQQWIDKYKRYMETEYG